MYSVDYMKTLKNEILAISIYLAASQWRSIIGHIRQPMKAKCTSAEKKIEKRSKGENERKNEYDGIPIVILPQSLLTASPKR